MPRIHLLPPALLAALALSAGTAAAATHTYDVSIDATIAYDHVKHSESHSPTRDNELDLSWHLGGKLSASLPMVSFVDGHVRESGNGIVTEAIEGRSLSVENDSWTGVTRTECVADAKPNAWGRASIAPVGFEGSGHVAVRLTDLLEVTGTCDDGRSPGATIAKLDGDVDDITGGPFDAVFDLPRDALGPQLIAQLVSGGAEGEHCPGYDHLTVSCKLTWTATVSFVRSDVADHVDPIKQPPPPGTGTNDDLANRAADAIRAELERRKREEAAENAKVDAVSKAIKDYLDQERIADTIRKVLSGGEPQANLNLTCPSACTGTVTATAGGQTLARATLRPAAKTAAAKAKGAYRATAKLKFDRADRRRAKRAGKVQLTFAVRVGAGKVQRVTTTVKVGAKRR